MKTFSKPLPFYKDAYEKARAEEIALLPFLQKHFNDPALANTESTYSKFDFISDARCIELKTRNVTKDKFPDLMINKNKIDDARRNCHQRDYIFVYRFSDDSVWYWKFDPSVELDVRVAGRMDRGYDERREFYFIPTSLLENIPLS